VETSQAAAVGVQFTGNTQIGTFAYGTGVEQLPLYFPLLPTGEATRLVFSARSMPVIGRDDEMLALRDFLKDDRAFSWWLLTGPAGSGKSRLALELCLEQKAGKEEVWHTGFLDEQRLLGFDWVSWQPDRSTLMVADYALTSAKVLGAAVQRLAERRDLGHRVRLLILERKADGSWRASFEGTGSRAAAVKVAAYAESLELKPLAPEYLSQIMSSVFERSVTPRWQPCPGAGSKS
jgi:hypothetical protein